MSDPLEQLAMTLARVGNELEDKILKSLEELGTPVDDFDRAWIHEEIKKALIHQAIEKLTK